MTEKIVIRQDECYFTAEKLARQISEHMGAGSFSIYGVPRGGVPVALMLASLIGRAKLVNSANVADVIVDDICDSGTTFHRFKGGRTKVFATLYAKHESGPIQKIQKEGNSALDQSTRFLWAALTDSWIVFPWEVNGAADTSADDICLRLLQFIGEDPKRGGLKETPQRYLKAWKEWSAGYGIDTKALLKTFEDGAESYDEMVVMRDIPIYSHCEHHLAPFFGEAHIAYIPNGKIVGLSKLARLAKALSQRLQVQERLTNQIADALAEALDPRGIAVVLQCRHLCMESRGISMRGSQTITSCVRGAISVKDAARAEFMNLIK